MFVQLAPFIMHIGSVRVTDSESDIPAQGHSAQHVSIKEASSNYVLMKVIFRVYLFNIELI